MQEDQQQQYDSDQGGDFEKPKDEFMFFYKAFKLEEKKFLQHQKFEELTGLYWQLLRRDPDFDISQPYITQPLYTKLMKSIYKLLLPLYREEEVDSEVKQEWLMDSQGQRGLNFSQLTKVLFRIAHEWATNIDLDEYLDLLNKIYQRIIKRNLDSWNVASNTITVEFPLEEKKIIETGGNVEKGQQSDDWLECRSDESNRTEYEYKYEEDPENMMVKKYKKQKGEFSNMGQNQQASVTIKDPFYYSENIIYNCDRPYYDTLNDLENIKPFGYFTEQSLENIKNEVKQRVAESRQQNQQTIAQIKRQMREENKEYDLSPYQYDKDTGLLEEPNNQKKQIIYYTDNGIQVELIGSGFLENHLRRSLRDGQNLSLRMYSMYPKPGAKSKNRSQLTNGDPITEINKFGYNPALERRVCYRQSPLDNGDYKNIYYMVYSKGADAIYRSDVQRVETHNKMAIKDSDEVKKEEEFINVETSYKKMRQIMLSKKFGRIYQDRCASDNKEMKRLKKLIEKEDKRKVNVQKTMNHISQKGLCETYEEKSFIKMMRGPFYMYESKEGIRNDDFANCAEEDLLTAANTEALRILLLGKPRSGKTTLAKNLAKRLDLVHVNVDLWIAQLRLKIMNYEPPDVEEGEEPPKFLTPLEEEVNELLKMGQGPEDQHIVQIIKEQVFSAKSRTKGFVLDLTFYNRYQSWASTLRQQFRVEEKAFDFTHVIELAMDDEEVQLRAKHLRVDPVSGELCSKWDREERKRNYRDPADEMSDVEVPEEQPLPLDENTLIQRFNDADERIRDELTYYNSMERPAMEEFMLNLYDNQYIRIDAASLTPDQLLQSSVSRILIDEQLPLRPIALQIESGGDFKSLLTEGLEENQIPRKWSYWKTQDPVALSNGKLVQGSPEYAAHYHNNVFVFETEDNLKKFLEEPKQYISFAPQMPNIYRVLMLGATGAGRHTQAEKLSETYGWQIVDFKEMVRSRIEEMLKSEIHIPNNPVPGGRIGLSEQELQEIVEGKSMPAWKFIPWILDQLGYKLEKKRPPPVEENQDQQDEQQEELTEEEIKKKKEAEAKKKKEEEEKKRKEEEEVQRLKEERRQRRQEAIEKGLDLAELGLENEEEEIIIIEDLPIDQLALKIDEETGKAPVVGGFILIGFPETEDQFNKLKEYGIEFDKVIYLNDQSEENAGDCIKERMKGMELYDYEQEMEQAAKIVNIIKEQTGEEIVKEINCAGTEEQVFIRIRNEIDPFYLKVDNVDDIRTSADLSDEDKRLPKGDFGDYCPVTYVNSNWLLLGSPDFEVIVNGKTYLLAGEKEAEEFKFNPKKYLLVQAGQATLPLKPPPPKIMVLGQKGAGVTTQIRMLCEKYKLEELNLKDELLGNLKEEKEKRKRRRLLERGFKPPLPAEEEGMEPPPDPEIEEDPEDFDRAAHEREVLQMILDSSKGLVIDGTWTDLPEDAVSQSLQDLLFESRRAPEIVIMLKCKEKSTFDRMIDYNAIKTEYDDLMQKREEERKKLRDEDREKKLEELNADEEKTEEEKEEEMKKWEEDRDIEDEQADENDPEKPNLEEMTEKFRETLRERRDKDEAFIEEFGTALKEKKVFVIDDIKTDISAEYVFIKLLDRIKDNFAYRNDLIERQLAQPLKPEEVKFFEQSHIYKHSKFGINSPLSLSNPIKTKKYTVLFRERIYFLANEEEQEKFLKEPSKYTYNVNTIPLDIQIKPKIFVLGFLVTGKTTICQSIAQKTGAVYLRIEEIIESFLDKDSIQCDQLRRVLQYEGKSLDDETIITFLLKRLQFADCINRGFVLEDFPKTRNQALFLARRGLVPSNVLYLNTKEFASDRQNNIPNEFDQRQDIYNSRLLYQVENQPFVLSFYQKYYNNVTEINARKSKWFVEDQALKAIQDNLEARQQFSAAYYLRDFDLPVKVKNLNMDRHLYKQSLSEFKYYCPVTWRNEKLLQKCTENFQDCLLFRGFFFYFKSQRERDLFIANPQRFITNNNFPKSNDLPLRLKHHKAAEIAGNEKALNGHCPSTLTDEERVVKGDFILAIHYKENKYVFETEYKLQKFLSNPFKYSKAVLPVKMPPPADKVSLYNLSKMEDSISFMEQALGQIVTRALREVSENRLKYPTISIKETMLKLFALFLKTNNPANTEFMTEKYGEKMKLFVSRCELPEEIFDLSQEKGKLLEELIYFIEKRKQVENGWPEFKEKFYNELGAKYDKIIQEIQQEKQENFINYIR